MSRTFTEREAKLIRKLEKAGELETLELREACPQHSVCTPLPLFRVYRTGDHTFEAQWNTYHEKGPIQSFHFSDVNER